MRVKMNKKNKHIQYSTADIRRYLEGKLSPEQMHLMEKAALNDPFLADALEGMEKNKAVDIEDELGELKRRLRETAEKHKQKNRQMWWKAAAVLLVILSGIAITVNLNEKPQHENALITKKEDFTDSGRNDAIVLATPAMKDSPSAVFAVPERELTKKRNEKPEKTFSDSKIIPAPLPQDKDVAASVPSKPDHLAKSDQQTAVKQSSEQLQSRAEGTEISGAESEAAEINADGKLDEVVVAGYGRQKKAANVTKQGKKKERIAPVGGWEAFDSYINLNKRISTADSLKNHIQEVSFVIDKEGRPGDIKIRRSISPAHDADAIRLLQEGPEWEILKGKKRKVTMRILF